MSKKIKFPWGEFDPDKKIENPLVGEGNAFMSYPANKNLVYDQWELENAIGCEDIVVFAEEKYGLQVRLFRNAVQVSNGNPVDSLMFPYPFDCKLFVKALEDRKTKLTGGVIKVMRGDILRNNPNWGKLDKHGMA